MKEQVAHPDGGGPVNEHGAAPHRGVSPDCVAAPNRTGIRQQIRLLGGRIIAHGWRRSALLRRVRVGQRRVDVHITRSNGEDIVGAGISHSGRWVDCNTRHREILGRRLHETSLHGVGSKAGALLQHQRHRARNCRRGHAGATQAEISRSGGIGGRRIIRLGNRVAGIQTLQRRTGREQRDHQVTRGDHVRLHGQVDIAGPFRAVTGDQIVTAGIGLKRLHAANRDGPGAVSRRQDRGITVASQVACRRYHDNPVFPCRFHRLTEWIPIAALINRAAQREVDHPHIVLTLQLHRLLDRGDDDAVIAHAVLIQHPQIEDIRVRGDSPQVADGARPDRDLSITSGDTGDVCSVPVIVILDSTADEALPVHHSRLAGSGGREVGVRIDSAVNDGDADASAVQSVAPGKRSVLGGSGIVICTRHRTVE